MLAQINFSVNSAIAQASNIFDCEKTYAAFEPNFYANWVHTRKCMHPDLISKVMSIVHECWKAGENTEK